MLSVLPGAYKNYVPLISYYTLLTTHSKLFNVMLSVLPCQSLIGSMYLDLHTFLWKVIAKNVSCLKYWVHFFKGDSQLNSDLVRKFSRPGIVSKASSMMCHSIWQKNNAFSKKNTCYPPGCDLFYPPKIIFASSSLPSVGFDSSQMPICIWYLQMCLYLFVFLCYVSPRPFLWYVTPIGSCW